MVGGKCRIDCDLVLNLSVCLHMHSPAVFLLLNMTTQYSLYQVHRVSVSVLPYQVNV